MKKSAPLLDKKQPPVFRAALLVCSATALILSGCSSEPESHVVSAPPPPTAPAQVVVQNNPNADSGSGSPSMNQAGQVIVTQAPPAMQQEPVLEQPSPRHVWIPGYWTYRDNRYVWIAGRWELPPTTGAVWIAPRWEREGNGYRYYEGYWK
jgi:YXWGXW repeat-containing protein